MDIQIAQPEMVVETTFRESSNLPDAELPAAEAVSWPAPMTLDEIFDTLVTERIERLSAARATNASAVDKAQAAYQAIADRIAATQAERTEAIAGAQAAVEAACLGLEETVRKADLARLYAAESNSPAAAQADAAADRALESARQSLTAAEGRVADLLANDETVKAAEAEEVAGAQAARDAELERLAGESASAEAEYADAVEELQRRAAAEAERQAARHQREAERQAKADDLIARAAKATSDQRLEDLLEEARTEKVQHLVEKHIARRRRELAAALKSAMLFARTFPTTELPAGDALAIVAPGSVDILLTCNGDGVWAPWQSWERNGRGWGQAQPFRNKREFEKRELFRLAARKGGQVITLRREKTPEDQAIE